MAVSALRDCWAGVPIGLLRGVVGRGEGLEVGERVERGEVGEVGEQRELEAELLDGGDSGNSQSGISFSVLSKKIRE